MMLLCSPCKRCPCPCSDAVLRSCEESLAGIILHRPPSLWFAWVRSGCAGPLGAGAGVGARDPRAYIYICMYSFILSFIHSYIHTYIHTFVHSFIRCVNYPSSPQCFSMCYKALLSVRYHLDNACRTGTRQETNVLAIYLGSRLACGESPFERPADYCLMAHIDDESVDVATAAGVAAGVAGWVVVMRVVVDQWWHQDDLAFATPATTTSISSQNLQQQEMVVTNDNNYSGLDLL